MKKCFALPILLSLFLIPGVRADAVVPMLMSVYLFNIILIIPIIIIEGVVAYFLIKQLGFRIGVLYSLFMSLVANLVSTFIGFFLSFISPVGGMDVISIFLMVVPAFIITFVIELPFIYIFIRSKTKEVLKHSAILSFVVNIISYIVLIVIMVFSILT